MNTAILLCAAHLWASAAEGGGVTLTPPPGWSDVTAAKEHPDILVALRGPMMSSFVLTKTESINTSNQAQVRALLSDVLNEMNKKTGLSYSIRSPVQTSTYKNNLTSYYVLAEAKGAVAQKIPKIVIAVADYKGMTLVGTLLSAAPESAIPAIMGAVDVAASALTGSPPPLAARQAVSLDGQLVISLRDGMMAAELNARDKAKGFVLAVSGLGSEARFLKVTESAASRQQEQEAVRQTLLSIQGVIPSTLSDVGTVASAEGPVLLYVSGEVADSAGIRSKLVVGFLPWAYWGYSVFAKGPGAVALLSSAVTELHLGPSANPRLVAATPQLGQSRSLRKTYALIVLAGILLTATLVGLRLRH